MNINTFVLLSGISVLAVPTQAATLYQADFQSGNALSSYGLVTKSGSAAIQHVFGAANDNQLVFNSPSGGYEQVQLQWPTLSGASTYRISFDLMTQGLTNSQYAFTVFTDTPTVQNLEFHGSQNWIETFNPMASGPSIYGTVGHFSDNTPMHVTVDIALANAVWNIAVDGIGQYQGPFYSSSGGISDLRFNLSPWYNGAAPAPNISVALDNLQISSVPLPGTSGLLLSALGALAIRSRKGRSSQRV